MKKRKAILMMSLLVVRNLIGAGILALPIQTGGAGSFAILFGVLPSIIFYIKSTTFKSKLLAIGFGILFILALGADLLNDFGVIDSTVIVENIKKQAEKENLK